jgi:toxin-antitoxin system PIN domain toxin
VIIPDVNLLLYAYDAATSEHSRARVWLQKIISTSEIVGFSWHTVLSFLRISTMPRMTADPYRLDEAIEIVEDWLAFSNARILSPTENHWRILKQLLPRTPVRGSLIMDAHLAALAIEHGATLCTSDRDFARFPGLKVEFPLQDSI